MKRYVVVWLLMGFVLTMAHAQSEFPSIGVRFGVSIPQGDFMNEVDEVGFSAGFNVDFPLGKETPLRLGIGFDFLQYSSLTTRFNEEIVVRFGNTVIDRIPVILDVTTSNNILHFPISFRFQPDLQYVMPYAEVSGGLQYLYTRTKITDETGMFTSDKDDNVINASTQQSDFTWFVAGAAGILIPFRQFSLELSGTYLMGGRAEYYTRADISDWTVEFTGSDASDFDPGQPDNLILEQELPPLRRSVTDQMLFRIGFRIPIQPQ